MGWPIAFTKVAENERIVSLTDRQMILADKLSNPYFKYDQEDLGASVRAGIWERIAVLSGPTTEGWRTLVVDLVQKCALQRKIDSPATCPPVLIGPNLFSVGFISSGARPPQLALVHQRIDVKPLRTGDVLNLE